MLDIVFIKNVFILFRVKHYVKNLFVFAPLLFTSGYNNIDQVINSVKVFVLFSLLSSVVYIFNDINDIQLDKKHPIKAKKRPLASGKINISQAYGLIFLLLLPIIGFIIFDKKLLIISLIFVVLNILYSIIFKKIAILDIFVLSSNYVIRVLAGSIGINVYLSSWMFITVFTLALFLSSLKRKQEVYLYGSKSRGILKSYKLNLLSKITDFSGILSVVFYSLYVITTKQELVITIPLVLYGFFRYYHLSEQKNFTDSPIDEILKDKQSIFLVLIWIVLVLFVN